MRTRSSGSLVDHRPRAIERVDGRDHLIAGVLEHMLVVERDERLVLDDEDPPDQSFALAEEHVVAGLPRS